MKSAFINTCGWLAPTQAYKCSSTTIFVLWGKKKQKQNKTKQQKTNKQTNKQIKQKQPNQNLKQIASDLSLSLSLSLRSPLICWVNLQFTIYLQFIYKWITSVAVFLLHFITFLSRSPRILLQPQTSDLKSSPVVIGFS